MSIYLGSSEPSKIYLGSSEVKEVYVGTKKVRPSIINRATQGPCPDGFHVPLSSEWSTLISTMGSLSSNNYSGYNTKLHMPLGGCRKEDNGTLYNQGGVGYYWSNTPNGSYINYRYLSSSYTMADWSDYRNCGFQIRPFKNEFVNPDSTWTATQGTIGGNGIFWNQTDGLISIIYNTNKITISDKNCGATTAYNGGALSESNCGKYYQWGNNYGFPFSGSITTSSSQINASTYGPGNYYESSTFRYGSSGWDSSGNNDLWGYVTGNVPVS